MFSDHRLRNDTGGIPQHGGPPDEKKLVGGAIAFGTTPPFGRLLGGGVEKDGGVHNLES